MNCNQLQYPDEFFDIIIEKSTIDGMLCGSNAYKKVAILLKECQRTLKTGGVFISVSFGQPQTRELHFKRPHLGMELNTVKIDGALTKGPAVS